MSVGLLLLRNFSKMDFQLLCPLFFTLNINVQWHVLGCKLCLDISITLCACVLCVMSVTPRRKISQTYTRSRAHARTHAHTHATRPQIKKRKKTKKSHKVSKTNNKIKLKVCNVCAYLIQYHVTNSQKNSILFHTFT